MVIFGPPNFFRVISKIVFLLVASTFFIAPTLSRYQEQDDDLGYSISASGELELHTGDENKCMGSGCTKRTSAQHQQHNSNFPSLRDRSMAWRCSGASHDALIRNLRSANIIKTDRVERAMEAVCGVIDFLISL